jgi:hypothetical protein
MQAGRRFECCQKCYLKAINTRSLEGKAAAFHMAYIREEEREGERQRGQVADCETKATATAQPTHASTAAFFEAAITLPPATAPPPLGLPKPALAGTRSLLSKQQEPAPGVQAERVTERTCITFLYKLVPGAAGQSFGLNVARVGGCARRMPLNHGSLSAAR